MDEKTKGIIIAAQGNLVTVRFDGTIRQNEVVFVKTGGQSLKGLPTASDTATRSFSRKTCSPSNSDRDF